MVTLPTATTKQGFPEERTATAKNKEKSSYWASTTTSLEKLARFQQKQLQEKEQKLLQLYDQQRQRAHQVAQRGSANNNNNGSGGNNNQTNVVASHKARAVQDAPSERRRQPKGIDKSYPLEPLRKPSIPTRQQKSIGQPRVNGLHYEINIDDAIDDEAMQRNRMVAKFQPRKSNSVTRKPNSTTSPRQSSFMKLTQSSSLKMRQKMTKDCRHKKRRLSSSPQPSRGTRCCQRERHISDDYDPFKSTSLVSEVIRNNSLKGDEKEDEDPCTGDNEKLGKVKTIVMKIENITSGLRASAKILFKLKRRAEEKKRLEEIEAARKLQDGEEDKKVEDPKDQEMKKKKIEEPMDPEKKNQDPKDREKSKDPEDKKIKDSKDREKSKDPEDKSKGCKDREKFKDPEDKNKGSKNREKSKDLEDRKIKDSKDREKSKDREDKKIQESRDREKSKDPEDKKIQDDPKDQEKKKSKKKIEDPDLSLLNQPRRPSADELRRESFELKRQMFEQILAENRRRDSVESALRCFDSISIEEIPPEDMNSDCEEGPQKADKKKPSRGFEKSTASWNMHIAREPGASVKKSQSLRTIKRDSIDYSFCSGKQNNNPGSPPSPAERGSSRQPQKASSMKFLSRIVGSNGDLEFTTENGYASAPQRKSSMPADLEQKTGVPVVASPRAVTTASPLAPGTNRPNIAGRSNVAAKPRPATTAKVQPPADSTDESNLTACKICNRKFATDRVTLHEQICAKTAQKKRKQFDVVTHRVKGTELESFAIKPLHKKQAAKPLKVESEPKVPKSNWRRKHEDFINAIRSAKQMQTYLASGGKLSDLPPPPPSDTSDYIQCPHCSRKFSQGAAERHIPRCTGGNKPKIAPRAKR